KRWDQYSPADNLVFVREDFNEPGKTPIWGELAALKHAEVSYLAGMLAALLARPVKDLPRLEAVISKSAGVKPLELKAGPPRPPEKKWNAKPSKAGTVLDLAPQWKVIWSRPGEKTESRWRKEVKDGPVEVESEVEVLAPAPLPVGAAVGAALAAGALLGTFFSPAAGLLAVGGGLVMTRGLTRMQKKRVKH